MALQKLFTIKGVDANYIRIHSYKGYVKENFTVADLAVYLSKEVRDESVDNVLEIKEIIVDGIDMTREEIYNKIKESKMEEVIVTPEIPATDETPTIPAVTEMKETNEWADAISV